MRRSYLTNLRTQTWHRSLQAVVRRYQSKLVLVLVHSLLQSLVQSLLTAD